MSAKQLRLGREVLDHQLADSEGVLCGKVDDLEFGEDQGQLTVATLLSGPGAATRRLPVWLRATLGRLSSNRVTRVEWAEIEVVGAVIRLRHGAAALGLGVADRRAGRWLRRLPRS